ncbi:LysR family transcriptional regulator [Roseibium denhamense]|uniref:LysR family transcriptional regulator, glycine cleavage system transcriptional activator n=1 Tax=Roseibium denhamense TaxID=76305 RepID=A0ABY1P0X6_9HYPH|nr:LysR substrate-binding domain-containing protein [Roseibium denhamense]MTI04934.1 LysR family transcriptional regulator [Roseibium denhamense]SMP23477.1 LysR family transcriptional regulator, glycine cleavage system transcriptional activator [Roseibium denhamense]
MASLRALHAFSLLARHGRAALAAEMLGVSPSALSHLMRKLEGELGATLVNRDGRGLSLTEEGQRLALSLGDAFDRIEDAVDSFKRRGRTELRISTVSTFATRWLIPRLPQFQAEQPDVELLLSTSTRMIDLDRENYDCAIRLGEGRWPGVESHLLWKEHLAVAVAPALLAGKDPKDPDVLNGLRLLHSASRRNDWSVWLEASGLTHADTKSGMVLQSRDLAIQAAIAGMGAIVIDRRFVSQELAAGHLIMPDWAVLELDTGYWFVRSPIRTLSRPVAAFRDWLQSAP